MKDVIYSIFPDPIDSTLCNIVWMNLPHSNVYNVEVITEDTRDIGDLNGWSCRLSDLCHLKCKDLVAAGRSKFLRH